MTAPQQGVIKPFTNEGEGWLRYCGEDGLLTYTGDIVAGKAEGRGTVRCEGEFTVRDAEFRGGRMLPCRAVIAWDNGDAYAGPLTTAEPFNPPDGARAAVVRGVDGGVFQGDWPADGKNNDCFRPYGGAAVIFPGGSVHRVTLRGQWSISSDEGRGWEPGPQPPGRGPSGTDGWGPAVCVMERPTADEAPFAGKNPQWAEQEYEVVLAFSDGSRFEGVARGLCPQHGVLTDTHGRQWRVAYSGNALLTDANLEPVTREEVAELSLEAALSALAPDAAATALALLQAEGVTAGQLRGGAVTDADLEGAGLAADARAAIAAWRAAAP